MKHTKGPWRVVENKIIGNEISVEASDLEDAIPITVIDCAGAMGGNDNKADARLIAAAPELLDALNGLLAGLNLPVVNEPLSEIDKARELTRATCKHLIKKAQAAINKAEGRD